MATSKEFDSSSDQITQLCNLCCKNVSDGYCVECEDYMCQVCFDIHIRVRACRHHELIDDINHPNFNKKTFYEPCKKHPNQNIEYYCVDHKYAGCVKCLFPKHRICNSESIEDAAQRFKTNGEDKQLLEEIQSLENTHSKYTKQNEIDTETAATVNEKTIQDMNCFTDRIISYTEKMKRDVLGRSERLHRENETRLEERLVELDSVGNEIEAFKVKLENNDNLEKLFIDSTEIFPNVKELGKKMASFGRQNVTTKYEFCPNKQIMDMLNDSKSFGKICIMSENVIGLTGHVATTTTPSPRYDGTSTTPLGNVATTTTSSAVNVATTPTQSAGNVAINTITPSRNISTTLTPLTVSKSSSQSHESAKHSPIDQSSEPNIGQSESSEVNESQDSDDIKVLENSDDKGEVQNISENFASISPPVSKIIESSSLPLEEKEDNSVNKISKTETKEVNQKKETENVKTDYANPNKNTGHVAAEKSSEDTSVPKTKGKFTLKPSNQRNFYLIKSDACSKPFKYTSKSVGVYIDDEDDLLYDGDNIYQIVVDNGRIKLDGLSAAETLNSIAITINPQGSQSSSNKADGTEQTDDAKKNTNSSTLADPGCESGKLSNKNLFCLSGAESKNTPIISMKTFHPKQPSKVTLYSFRCKNMGIFLKWTFALRNKSLLKQITQEYKNVAINCPDDVLVIEDPDRKYCTEEMAFDVASSVIAYIIGITKTYKSERISLDGDASMILSAVRQLQVYQDQQIVEYYDEDGDVLWVLFHSSQRKHLIDVIDKARVKHIPSDKQFVETLSLHFFMHKILSGKQFRDDFEESCKNVDITHQVVDSDDSVIVTLRSACKEDAESAKKWICSKEQNYASASFSYEPLNVPPQFEASVVVDEFLKRSFEGKDFRYVRNETTQNVWIWSESLSQIVLNKERRKLKAYIERNEVIKKLPLHSSKWNTTVLEKLGVHENNAFVKISYEGENVTITGLCQIVDQIGCELKKGSHSGLDQTSSTSSTSPTKPFSPQNSSRKITSSTSSMISKSLKLQTDEP